MVDSAGRAHDFDFAASIRGRTALITGGARGIGRAIAETLRHHGANVAITYNRSKREADAFVASAPDRSSAHPLDQRSDASVDECFAEVEKRWGALHIVVDNAAAGSATVASYESQPERWDEALVDINATGALRVCKRAVAVMKRHVDGRGSKLINIASVGALVVMPAMRLSDNMSKAAVVYMSRQLAAENCHTGIDVFCICPSATDTDMFQRSTLNAMSDDERKRYIARLPKGKLTQPEEIARIAVFLASEYGAVLHGAVLDASYGLGVHPGLVTGSSP